MDIVIFLFLFFLLLPFVGFYILLFKKMKSKGYTFAEINSDEMKAKEISNSLFKHKVVLVTISIVGFIITFGIAMLKNVFL